MSRSYLRDSVSFRSRKRLFLLWKVLVWKKAHGYKCEHDKGRKKGEESRKKVSGAAGRNGKISGAEREESQGMNSL